MTYFRKRLKHEKGYGLVPINGKIAKTFSLSYRAMWRRASFWVGNSNTADMVYAYLDYEPKDSEYLKDVKGCATYTEIKDWIKSEYGLKGSSLYVAQIKDKCGFDKRLNYYIGENKSRVPKCPPEKEKAIMAAFSHCNII